MSIQLDSEIEKLDNLDSNDLEQIRKRRIEAMKNHQLQKIEWEKNGKVIFVDQISDSDLILIFLK